MGAGLGLALSSTNSNLMFNEDSFLINASIIDPSSFTKQMECFKIRTSN